MCGPNDIATARSVSSVSMPTGVDVHVRAVVRARREQASRALVSAMATMNARSKFVIFRNGSRSDQPKSSAIAVIADRIKATEIARLRPRATSGTRSEEHTSELQSPDQLVC